MPELPEVETIRRGLEEKMLGRVGKVLDVKVYEQKSLIGEPEIILGAEIEGFDRKGKALIVHFSNGFSAIIHLRMTGQLIWREKYSCGDIKSEQEIVEKTFAGGHPSENFVAKLPNKQTRVEIVFENGVLFFNDQRKFGFIKILERDEVKKDKFIKKLAKEPWEMTPEELFSKLQKHKGAPIKTVILDQTVIAGLGNIYADEALYFSGINPKRKAGELTEEETGILLLGARKVMEKSIEAGGSTIRNYVKSDGTRGDYLDLFAEVYNREGKECRKCKTKIVKEKLGGRGTHYCPKCQKEN
ncbi:bifunctional DNA-formamidopyrimidine glycosylase/DNA-(apurinic or apyrimidinic site) lyase [Candidatus Saccharibacteria bacterium]|nr:bifunctional DNA-formamidopyrimidine glycosylase/DNA-(apurinic or apyrimidinic site) lyase [Candidatus Saccharibacteria bacterium]